MTDIARCSLCGEPMPEGETMFKFHGYSGPCPKPPLSYVQRYSQARTAAREAADEKLKIVRKAGEKEREAAWEKEGSMVEQIEAEYFETHRLAALEFDKQKAAASIDKEPAP